MTVATFLCVAGTVTFNGLGVFIPDGYWSTVGNNGLVVNIFSTAFGINAEPLKTAEFISWLRVALTFSWVGYIGMLWLALAHPEAFNRKQIIVATILCLAAGILLPPWLSSDVFSYIAYGRMQAIYGLSPYLELPSRLSDQGDTIATFLQWDATSRYGPLWTLVSAGLALLLGSMSIFAQVLGMKLVAAVAYVALALGVARLSSLVKPSLQQVAFLSIAFSPLFISEGLVNAHNDITMLAFAVWGVVFWQRGLLKTACLLFGVAWAVKFITFILPVWLIGQRFAKNPRQWRSSFYLMAIVFAPFLLPQIYLLPDVIGWLAALEISFAGTPSATVTPNKALLIPFLFAALLISLAVLCRLMHWAVAWTVLSFLAIVTIGPVWPWYLMWPGIFIFSGYSRLLPYTAIPYVAACFVCMIGYSTIGGSV